MSNIIHTIEPYRIGRCWFFDDQHFSLHKEAFVSGMPEIINEALFQNGLEDASKFVLLFSAYNFPSASIVLELDSEPSHEGNWYKYCGLRGWLCPALFHYFDYVPEKIFCQVLPHE